MASSTISTNQKTWSLRSLWDRPIVPTALDLTKADIPWDIDLDTAKAALEQINKRLEASLALKTSTETRALALATQCTTLLAALAGATLIEWIGAARTPLVHAGSVAVVVLAIAIGFAHSSARPSKRLYLPGRLPREVWPDLTAEQMKAPEFIARLIAGLQVPMEENELAQNVRANRFKTAINFVVAAPLLGIIAAVTPPLGTIEFVHNTWVAVISFIRLAV